MTDSNRHGPVTSPFPPLSRFDGRVPACQIRTRLLPFFPTPIEILQPCTLRLAPGSSCCPPPAPCSQLALCSARCCLRATVPPPAPQRVMYQSERCRRHRRPAVCAAAATQTRRESRRALSPKRRGCCPLHSEGRLCTLRLSHTSNVAALYSHGASPEP